MTLRVRTITVKQLPPRIDRSTERAVLRELSGAFQAERPAIVLDCSQLRAMDSVAVHLLLSCLEEAMKHNGDVRLARVSAPSNATLEAWGVDRLFRTFETTQEAADSFQRRTAIFPSFADRETSAAASEHAA